MVPSAEPERSRSRSRRSSWRSRWCPSWGSASRRSSSFPRAAQRAGGANSNGLGAWWPAIPAVVAVGLGAGYFYMRRTLARRPLIVRSWIIERRDGKLRRSQPTGRCTRGICKGTLKLRAVPVGEELIPPRPPRPSTADKDGAAESPSEPRYRPVYEKRLVCDKNPKHNFDWDHTQLV
jgi:hypothetical protein